MVDEKHHAELSKHSWSARPNDYAQTKIHCDCPENKTKNGWKQIMLHQLIWLLEHYPGSCPCNREYMLKDGVKMQIDHIRDPITKIADKLDNRLEKLRVISGSLNGSDGRQGGASKYTGVAGIKNKDGTISWRVKISLGYISGKQKRHTKTFKTEDEAAHYFDDYCRQNNLDRILNFPLPPKIKIHIKRR